MAGGRLLKHAVVEIVRGCLVQQAAMSCVLVLRHCGRVAGGQRLLFLLLRFGGVQEAGGVSQVGYHRWHGAPGT